MTANLCRRTPKVFDLLLLLVQNHGRVIEKHRLMREAWPDTFVEEGKFEAEPGAQRGRMTGLKLVNPQPY